MKTLFFILSFFSISLLQAQDYYSIEHIQADLNGMENVPVSRLVIQKVDMKLALTDWAKFFKKNDKNEVIATERSVDVKRIVLDDISAIPLNIYTEFQEKREGLEMLVLIQDSMAPIVLEEHVNGFAYEKKLVAFAKYVYQHQLQDDLKAEQSHFNKLEKEAQKIQKGIDKLEKNKINLEVDLSNTKKEIELGFVAYDDIINEVNVQKSVVAKTPKESPDHKMVKKELDGLEKRKKEIDKEVKSNKELVYDTEIGIALLEKQIAQEKENYLAMDEKVQQQRKLVLKIEEEIYEVEHR